MAAVLLGRETTRGVVERVRVRVVGSEELAGMETLCRPWGEGERGVGSCWLTWMRLSGPAQEGMRMEKGKACELVMV